MTDATSGVSKHLNAFRSGSLFPIVSTHHEITHTVLGRSKLVNPRLTFSALPDDGLETAKLCRVSLGTATPPAFDFTEVATGNRVRFGSEERRDGLPCFEAHSSGRVGSL